MALWREKAWHWKYRRGYESLKLCRIEYENVVLRFDYENSLFEIYVHPIDWSQYDIQEIARVQNIVDKYMNNVIALNLSVYMLWEL
jgi:hypothetical protein